MSQSQKTVEFLQKLKDIGHWNDDYDYSEVDYLYAKSKIIIIDKSYNTRHLISASHLISRNAKCVISNAINLNEYILKVFKATHNDLYVYDKFNYVIEPKYPEQYHKWYDWYIPSLDLYIELDGGIRPQATIEKIKINRLLHRKCLIIPTYTIKSPNRNTLEDFMEF